MAEEKKETVKKTPAKKAVAEKAEAPKAKEETKTVKATKVEKAPAKEEAKKVFAPATHHDYEIVREPIITEKSMALLQNENKVTVKVSAKANKAAVKVSFQRLYGVSVDDVKIVNVLPRSTTRGGRYKGQIPGYKKAIITIHEGEAIDLFKE